ncbi:MAG: hypothetical protein U1E59_22005 [Amaricoccus sp.]
MSVGVRRQHGEAQLLGQRVMRPAARRAQSVGSKRAPASPQRRRSRVACSSDIDGSGNWWAGR